jgi:hypothetical protein
MLVAPSSQSFALLVASTSFLQFGTAPFPSTEGDHPRYTNSEKEKLTEIGQLPVLCYQPGCCSKAAAPGTTLAF